MTSVRLENVGKTYDNGVEAAREVSLAVDDGEFIVLVGPSGSGKSTVLRMIAGLEEITSGKITIGERVVNRLHPKDRDIAMVFQDYALYPHMTVRQNLGFGLRMKKVPRSEIDRRTREVADLLGIGDLLARRPGALSGGQQQRVALGRAIIRDPAVFLFDEPLSNLDAKLRVSMRSEIRRVQRRLGVTSIYVTHDQEEAMTMADRMVVMSGGRVQQVDAPLQVYAKPANRFVASFVGTPTMNFFDGRLRRDGNGCTFEEQALRGGEGIRLPLPLDAAEAMTDAAMGNVVLGLRPQDFNVADPDGGDPSGGTLLIRIEYQEPLGDVVDVHGLTTGGSPVVARVRAHEFRAENSTLRVRIDPDRAHLFEPGAFGRAL